MLAFGNKNIEPITITFVNGREYQRINLEYYVTEQEFVNLRSENNSLKDIRKIIGLNCSDSNFLKLIKKNGWHDNKIVQKYKHSVNETFFSKWSNETAWILGWIITDGNVTHSKRNKSLRFRLDSIDEDVLLKIKKLLNYSGNVKQSNELNGYRSILNIHRESICNDLFKLGIPKTEKTESVRYPRIACEEYEGDFLRGVFEGDGCSSIRTDRGNSIEIFIVSGSEYFLKDIKQRLKVYGIKSTFTVTTSNCFRLSIYRIADCLKFYYIIYKNTNSEIRMNRKFNNFKAYIDNYKIHNRTTEEEMKWLSLIKKEILSD